MNNTLANGTINEPAQVAHLKLPCRTLTFQFKGALFLDPAGLLISRASIDPGEQKIELPLRMNRDGPPPLFVTMNGLNRSSKQLCNLLLSLVQSLSDGYEFLAIHYLLHKNIQNRLPKVPQCGIFIITSWYICQQNNLAFRRTGCAGDVMHRNGSPQCSAGLSLAKTDILCSKCRLDNEAAIRYFNLTSLYDKINCRFWFPIQLHIGIQPLIVHNLKFPISYSFYFQLPELHKNYKYTNS